MITLQEVELLALLLQRVGVNPIETAWANGLLDRLRQLATETPQPQPDPTPGSGGQ